MHSFQKKQLCEVNSIPQPSSSLERFLDRFVVDFGPGSTQITNNHNGLNISSSKASAMDASVMENGGRIRSEEDLGMSLIK